MLAFTYSLNNVLFETHSHSSLKLHNVLHAHTYHNVVVIKKWAKDAGYGVITNNCNIYEAEAGGLQVHGVPGLHSKFQTTLGNTVRP